MTLKFDERPQKPIRHLFDTTPSFVHHFKSIGEFKLELQPGNAQFGQKLAFFVPYDLENWQMTLKNNRIPLPYYNKLCAAFQSHWYIQTGVTVWKQSIRVKIGDFLSRVSLKFGEWPWITILHLFYTTLSFVQYFKAICVFKLDLQSGNTRFGPKLTIFCPAWP